MVTGLLILAWLAAFGPPALGKVTLGVRPELRAGASQEHRTRAGTLLHLVSEPKDQAPSSQEFSSEVPETVLSALRTALVQEDLKSALACFDPDMPDFTPLSDSVHALFDRYTDIRVRYHILQTGDDHARAAVVEFTLEATPVDPNQLSQRRTEQLRFNFAPSGHGWRIADLQPRDLFSGF
jgi:hypothetical protein